ncbi:MAG TPA: F0F1 ATP synthase subunit delta [Thermomicrobiales bacterium]|jgi:F-type H+-transporting ATPase subunit delta|nr:F0F1 ATP synthase subunit delta [Thermomicrobiales bacterium]
MARNAARRYAEAIVALARETGSFELWDRDLRRLADSLRDEQTARFLVNPGMPVAEKRKALELILGDGQLEAHNLVRILMENRRLPLLPDIYDVFSEAWLAEQGIVVAHVTTAEPVSADDERLIRQRLTDMTGRKIELRLRVDPELIGGLVARIGDTVLDGSVQSKLRALRQRLNVASA